MFKSFNDVEEPKSINKLLDQINDKIKTKRQRFKTSRETKDIINMIDDKTNYHNFRKSHNPVVEDIFKQYKNKLTTDYKHKLKDNQGVNDSFRFFDSIGGDVVKDYSFVSPQAYQYELLDKQTGKPKTNEELVIENLKGSSSINRSAGAGRRRRNQLGLPVQSSGGGIPSTTSTTEETKHEGAEEVKGEEAGNGSGEYENLLVQVETTYRDIERETPIFKDPTPVEEKEEIENLQDTRNIERAEERINEIQQKLDFVENLMIDLYKFHQTNPDEYNEAKDKLESVGININNIKNVRDTLKKHINSYKRILSQAQKIAKERAEAQAQSSESVAKSKPSPSQSKTSPKSKPSPSQPKTTPKSKPSPAQPKTTPKSKPSPQPKVTPTPLFSTTPHALQPQTSPSLTTEEQEEDDEGISPTTTMETEMTRIIENETDISILPEKQIKTLLKLKEYTRTKNAETLESLNSKAYTRENYRKIASHLGVLNYSSYNKFPLIEKIIEKLNEPKYRDILSEDNIKRVLHPSEG